MIPFSKLLQVIAQFGRRMVEEALRNRRRIENLLVSGTPVVVVDMLLRGVLA